MNCGLGLPYFTTTVQSFSSENQEVLILKMGSIFETKMSRSTMMEKIRMPKAIDESEILCKRPWDCGNHFSASSGDIVNYARR